MEKEFQYHLDQLSEIIPQVWENIHSASILCLKGDLGAGKTTFTRALCSFLKTSPSASSPTFSLINEYTYRDEDGQEKTIYHSDWYRIKDEEEAVQAGIEDMLQQKDAFCIIEWPEKAEALLKGNRIDIHFEIKGPTERKITIRSA